MIFFLNLDSECDRKHAILVFLSLNQHKIINFLNLISSCFLFFVLTHCTVLECEFCRQHHVSLLKGQAWLVEAVNNQPQADSTERDFTPVVSRNEAGC